MSLEERLVEKTLKHGQQRNIMEKEVCGIKKNKGDIIHLFIIFFTTNSLLSSTISAGYYNTISNFRIHFKHNTRAIRKSTFNHLRARPTY